MKYILLIVSVLLFGCTDTQIASIDAYGKQGSIKCYSGGKLIYEGVATGRIQTVHQSDGWEFKDSKSGKFLRVTGDCVIEN